MYGLKVNFFFFFIYENGLKVIVITQGKTFYGWHGNSHVPTKDSIKKSYNIIIGPTLLWIILCYDRNIAIRNDTLRINFHYTHVKSVILRK